MTDDRWWMEVSDDSLPFAAVLNNVLVKIPAEGHALLQDTNCTPLTPKECLYVTECLQRAENHYAKAEVEAAWYYLLCAADTVSYRSGVEDGAFQSSDVAGATRVASAHGKKGADAKALKRTEERKVIVDALLAQHQQQPFKIQKQLKDAALLLSPGKGKEERDLAWVSRVLKDQALNALYITLSKRRKV